MRLSPTIIRTLPRGKSAERTAVVAMFMRYQYGSDVLQPKAVRFQSVLYLTDRQPGVH